MKKGPYATTFLFQSKSFSQSICVKGCLGGKDLTYLCWLGWLTPCTVMNPFISQCLTLRGICSWFWNSVKWTNGQACLSCCSFFLVGSHLTKDMKSNLFWFSNKCMWNSVDFQIIACAECPWKYGPSWIINNRLYKFYAKVVHQPVQTNPSPPPPVAQICLKVEIKEVYHHSRYAPNRNWSVHLYMSQAQIITPVLPFPPLQWTAMQFCGSSCSAKTINRFQAFLFATRLKLKTSSIMCQRRLTGKASIS